VQANPIPTLLAAALLAAPLVAQDAPSEETIDFFARNCQSCHTIGGGRLTGPDLKGFDQRRDRDWGISFLLDPKAVLDGGGDYEKTLLQDARGVYMPPVTGINPGLAGKLYDLIAAEGALPKSRFAGIQVSDRPLTAEDVARGRRLFTGQDAFEGGGPSCASCHTTAGLGGLGGGILGPDLTAAYARLEGRTALAAWLSAPPSPVMQPVFADHALDGEEVLALVAWLQDEARSGATEGEPRTLPFVLSGIALAGALLVLFDLAWKGRFRGVRRPLVHEGRDA
jgi:mono/diheme cytochrome c family protein